MIGCLCLLAVNSWSAVFLSEDFTGTLALRSYNEKHWSTNLQFGKLPWENAIGILKETTMGHSGMECARFYGPDGKWNTSEMYTPGDLNVEEFWASWYEMLSPDYKVSINHKWILVALQGGANLDFYTNFQCNGDGRGPKANMRVYSQPLDVLYGSVTKELPVGTWMQYKLYYKLNTPGQSDGVIRLWVRNPGKPWELWQSYSGINIRGKTSHRVKSLRLGGTRSDYPSYGSKWIDDVVLGSTESEVEGGR